MWNCWIFRESRRATSRPGAARADARRSCAIAVPTARALSSPTGQASPTRGSPSSTSPPARSRCRTTTRRVSITFNGEIFNYVELRQELIARGHKFRTSSDTEVIIRLYEEMGPDCVERLNGDFAFAIWDARRRQMMLARDRMGVRPLFYAERGGALYFASEVKALLEVPGIDAELDPIALDQIFTFWFPLAPRTIFKGVSELPPAHVLVANADGVSVRRYWSLDFPDAADARREPRSEDAIAEEVRELLIDATRIRLRSDVPVGAYLSGGLDSSIVAAIAGRLAPERLQNLLRALRQSGVRRDRIPAGDGGGARHRSQRRALPPGRYRRDLSRRSSATPSGRSCGPRRRRSSFSPALVRDEGFKVVLTGEGADEVFGGYDIFKEAKLRRFCAVEPQSLRRPLLFRKLYPVSAETAGAVGGLSEGVLRHRSRRGRRSALLASAAFPLDRRREALLLRRAEAHARRLRRARRSSRQPAREFRALASAVAGAVSRNRAISCRATSSPRRATAWRWRMRSRAASPSSTIASWRWRRKSRRR